MAWTGATAASSIRPPSFTAPTITAPTAAAQTTAPPATSTILDPNDPGSPYFLHPNENPALVLVSAPLDGRNYHPWARGMEMALLSKNKLGFVDGTVVAPDVSDVKFPYWRRCNNMVATWIMRSLSPEIAQTVLWVGTAERIWKTLKSRFSEADIFRVSDLRAEMHQICQGDLSIGAYFAKLKALWDELQVIRPLPTCNCARRCDRGLLDKLQLHLDSDNLSVFLRGLNDNYALVQSQIMMMKPLPSVDEAFLIVQQQERRFNNGIGSSPQSTENLNAGSVFFSQTTGSNSGTKKFYSNGNKKPIFTYCGYTAHTVEKCYKKHGYPPGWKPRNKSVGSVNQVQMAQNPSEDTISLSQNEYMMLKQLLQRENNTCNQNSPLDVEARPQANLISANFVPSAQL
ncbi:PREDICTED: uncharacterized protein LOC109183034 [Ipomoea nil]|uniref:uncharacterized protein LOC109183034 n=1 Tax=Ipomoea nil TaxID=35883 RepID=UPI000900A76F|nr:PREDICTED: uncharacterized protein LOC109183034 [Ipomoea nil]